MAVGGRVLGGYLSPDDARLLQRPALPGGCSVIHGVGGEQDMRKMVGCASTAVDVLTMTIATFAIAGIPPLAGFFSKDEILWMAYISRHGSWFLVNRDTSRRSSRPSYMFRLWFMTFFW